jgi:tetratricopeptide (TPR) repeat protein
MKRGLRAVVVAIGILAWTPVLAGAESPAEAFARGKSLLEKGDFDGALGAFAAAARGDLDNDSYRQQYAMVRRIADLRRQLDAEKDPERWEYTARALHAFYLDQRLYDHAVDVARRMHEKLGTAASGTMLAETELALNRNAEAEKTLASLERQGHSGPVVQALRGIALARLGKIPEAKKLAATIALGDDAGPQLLYSLARLHGATGNADAAVKLLEKCFQALPPSRLENFKEHARLCPDFAAMASTASFAKALETESQVAESKCSGGAGCAGCPMRGKCGKAE